MDCPQVLPDLKRVIGGEGRALLHRFDLLHPLVEQMVMQARANRLRQLALLDQQIAQLNSEVADISSRLAEARVTLRYQQLKSPLDGVVFDLQPTSAGYTAQSTETVMKVVPFGSLEASVEVPSNKIGFVRVPVGCPK